MTDELQQALAPAFFVDSDHEAIIERACSLTAQLSDPARIAERLFYAVRDGFRYDPYNVSSEIEAFRASRILSTEANWCVPKAIVLTALARASGIPARLGFADVRNHLSSEKLSQSMGTDLFVWHGYSELWLGERWVKLSTAFNQELCERFGVRALEFDPVAGALMHAFDQSGRKHMEYVHDRGTFLDLPIDDMFRTFAEIYPGWVVNSEGRIARVPQGGDERDARFH